MIASETARYRLELPEDLLMRAEAAALAQGITLSALVERELKLVVNLDTLARRATKHAASVSSADEYKAKAAGASKRLPR